MSAANDRSESVLSDAVSGSVIPDTAPVLEVRGVTKRFGGATALNNVSFDLRRGEIHGLVGENGAGKSTLVKILSGVQEPDAGELLMNGEPIRFKSSADAQNHGIGMIYQELTMMPALSVAENVFLGRQPTNRFRIVDWKRMRKDAREQLAAFGMDVDVDGRVGKMSLGNQQLVEIARVVYSGADVIILDEPTSALSPPEAERLFEVMKELRDRGKSLIFISHFLEDVLAVSDRVTVLKNSKRVASEPVDRLSKHRLIEYMIGGEATELAKSYEVGITLPTPTTNRPVLELEHLSATSSYKDVSLTIHEGEILGVFGYLGSGMTEIARSLFGTMKPDAGTIKLDGEVIAPKNPHSAKKLGLAYLTENRRATLFPKHEIYKNVTLAHLDHLVRPVFRHPAEIDVTDGQVARTGVRPRSSVMLAGHLSGGNQQKVVLAKWLTKQPKVLILNEPTRGMDVGAKREVLDLVKQLKAEGVAILLLSTEPETVLTESDRILVMSKGRITREFADERVTKEDLMENA